VEVSASGTRRKVPVELTAGGWAIVSLTVLR
jgi:hypothetical protein